MSIPGTNIKKPKILVCGDIMLDHYIYTNIDKIANEAPIPVFRFIREEYALGGCGNVLRNLHSLGCSDLYIFSVIGDDINGKRLYKMIGDLGIHNYLTVNTDVVTTSKTRYFCDSKILFRCDSEKSHAIDISEILINIEACIHRNDINCIVLSDYDKGFLTKELCRAIICLAEKHNIFTCVDPKKDYTKYIGCSLIKPNRSEAKRLMNAPDDTHIVALHEMLHANVQCKYSVITMSDEGITLYDKHTLLHERPNIRKVVDVTGAGDIVTSILSYFIPSGYDIQAALRIATSVATISVEHPGTYIISQKDIYRTWLSRDIVITQEMISSIRELHDGRQIVFTNGCFDLLHRGHLSLLKFCREKGDIVIVGINSDSSVRILKGNLRPIQDEITRSQILAGISYVDYVIIFDDLTPLKIIKELRPDVLIKGGDYTVESIIGREYAKETIIFSTIEGVSTSNTITHILDKSNTP